MAILIKTFQEKDLEYAQNLLNNGDLFFQHISTYRSIEDNNIRGDAKEGTQLERIKADVPISAKQILIGSPQGGKQFVLDLEKLRRDMPALANMSSGYFELTYTVDWLLYCMTYLDKKTNADETLRKLTCFGKYSVVITDYFEFISKVEKTIQCEKGLVSYSDRKELSPFIKSEQYRWQNEFRLGMNANGVKSRLISIGKIKGFICNSKDIQKIRLSL